MYVIGVTGGVGTGKSTVTRMLCELGAATIDADQLAHDAILPHGPAYAGLVAAFGQAILQSDGSVSRHKLAQLAFGSEDAMRRLNAIVHPPVIESISARVTELAALGRQVVVLDVPLLHESGLDRSCDEVWVVKAWPSVRRRRLLARNGPAADQMIGREAWQMPMAAKVARADVVIDTSHGFARTLAQVRASWLALQERLAARGSSG
jgi:dephospho-CoA kinase